MKSRGFSWSFVTLLLALAATAPAAEPIPLRAGPLSMVFEPDNAFLRYLKIGSNEVLRGISAPVRDQFWATVRPQVTGLKLENQGDHFSLGFDASCREREIDFHWHGTIQGHADGRVEFIFDGQALSTFLRNRIGFCLLHGQSVAGRPWVLEDSHGAKTEGQFPTFIAPHQPAQDLRAISHQYAPGRWAHVRFEGDIFEMEDQRNWTDASFKTYCTPLALPIPVRLAKGATIHQKITIQLESPIPKTAADRETKSPITLTVGTEESSLPGLGLQVSSEIDELSARELQRIQSLHLDHLRVDLALTNSAFREQLRQAARQAEALKVRLVVGLHLGPAPADELKKLGAELAAVRPPVALWLVIGADRPTYSMARDSLKRSPGAALVGVGEQPFFAELNRNRPTGAGIEAVSYGLNPQVHTFDNASMMETLPIEGDTVRSARQFVGDLSIVVSPVTLRVQQLTQTPLPGELPANEDPRQPSLFAAAWTLGSLKYLSEAGVSRITYFETVGRKGVMASSRESMSPEKFPARPEQAFPLYYLLRSVGEFAGGRVQRVESTDASAMVGLALRQGVRRRCLLANLTNKPQTVSVRGLGGKLLIDQLSEEEGRKTNAGESKVWHRLASGAAGSDAPLVVPSYGVIQIDSMAD